MPAALKYVATTSAVSRQRSRSGEVPVLAFHTLAVSPGMSRQRSRSGELPVTPVTALKYVAPPQVAPSLARSREASCSSKVSMTAFRYVAASPTISRQSSPLGLPNIVSAAKTSPDLSRERSRSVEVPVQVISPPRTLPRVVLGSIQDTVENSHAVSVGKAAGDRQSKGKENVRKRATMEYVCSLQRSAYLNAAEDGPKIEVHRERKPESRSVSKKRFLDASSWISSTVDAKAATGKTDLQDSSSQEGAGSSLERAVDTVKLRWQAGRFSVVNRQAAHECRENQSVRYFDGVLEVDDVDLPRLRALLASRRAVSIGDQPGTGLTGAAVTPRPEFFHNTATALEGTGGKTFCFPVLIRHPGCSHPGCSRDASAERHEERMKVEKVQVDEANAKARAAELKAFQMGLGCLAIHKRANVAEKERDEEKARAEAVKKEEEEAMAKARAAEQKAIEAEKERNAVHQRAMVIERELDTEKAKVETAEAEVAEAHARLRAAELKAFQMGLGCLADHKRANAAEKERDEEKAKAEAAQTKLEEAMAKAQAAEVKAAEAEAERDAARQRAIAAEIERDAEKARGQRAIEESHLAKVRSLASDKWCDEERWSIQTASTTGSSAELFDTSNSGTTLAELDSPDSLECGESASGTAHTQGGSKPKAVEFPAHLHDEAALAHAYLPVDAYVSLVLSEFPQSKQVENSRQQLSA
mmetsp:Transcript_93301/g.179362  ORF Transcript_93301/g.179362 Transcript_93301/m.179362 type:complete len:700 (+) Transcript_93301:96-2195(+)